MKRVEADVGSDEKIEEELLGRVVKRLYKTEMIWEELRRVWKWWPQLKKVRQGENELAEQNWENVSPHSILFALDPIIYRCFLLESFPIRLVQVLIV